MKKLIFLGLSGLLLLIGGCKEDMPPLINSGAIDGKTNEIIVIGGTTLNFGGTAEDDKGLASWHISISDRFADYKRSTDNAALLPVSETRSSTLSGTVGSIIADIPMPAFPLAGPYLLVLEVEDEAGNTSFPLGRKFSISNGSEPKFGIITPDLFNLDPFIELGDTMNLQGFISDDVDLQEIRITLGEDLSLSTPKVYDETFDLSAGTADRDFYFTQLDSMNKLIIIPTTTEPGNYQFQMQAIDDEGNLGLLEAGVRLIQP